MLDGLYWIFIQPIEILLIFIFSITENLSSSRSTQIIYLSLAVSILLVPIYNLFDYWQNKDRIVEKAMNPKLNMVKNSFQGQERFAMLKTVYRQFGYHPIYGVRNSLGFLLQIPFFIAAYQFLSYNPAFQDISSGMFKNLSAPDQLIRIGDMRFNLWPILMTVFNLISGFIYSKGLMRKDKIQIIAIAAIFLVLLYDSASGLVLYWTFNNIFSLIKNLIHRYFSPEKKVETFISLQRGLPYLAGILFLTISFFYYPSRLIESDPFIFKVEDSRIFIISNYISALIIGLYLIYLLKYFLFRLTKIIDILLFVIAIFALITTIYNFFDTGVIDQFAFSDITAALGPLGNRLGLDLIFIIIIIAIYRYFKASFKNFIVSISIVVLVIFSFYTTSIIPYDSKRYEVSNSIDNGGDLKDLVPEYLESGLTFSKNHSNIIVLMLDGFTNSLLGELLKYDPKLESLFSGFTWYENTLSTGNVTLLGGPAIHGGLDISPYVLNQRSNQIESIQDEINKAYVPLIDTLISRHYDIDLLNMQYTHCDVVGRLLPAINVCTEYGKSEKDFNSYFVKKHLERFPEEMRVLIQENNNSGYLASIGIFYSAFYSLREYIYNDADWLSFLNYMPSFNIDYRYYAFLTSYIDLVSIKETESPMYKYINSGFTHEKWHLFDETCRIAEDGQFMSGDYGSPTNNQFYTHYCALKEVSRLVDKLKLAGAWDNTMMIVVSDHSTKGDAKLAKTFEASQDAIPGRPSSLLLVKEFNATHDFEESQIFMSQGDVPAIICNAIGSCLGVGKDPRINPNPQRKLHHVVGGASLKRHEKDYFNLEEVWEVTGDMYQRENWKEIEEKPSQ